MWWIYLQFLCLIFVILAAGYEEEILQTGPSPATETPHSTPELSSRFFISCKSKVPNQFLHGEQYLLLPDEGCGCRSAHWISAHLSATYPDSLLPTDNSNCSLPLLHSRCTPASSSLLTWYYLSVYSRSPIWKHMWIKVKDLSLIPTAQLLSGTGAVPTLNVSQWMRWQFWKSVYTHVCVHAGSPACCPFSSTGTSEHNHYRHNCPVGQLAMKIKHEIMGPLLATSLTQSKSFTRES